MARPRINIDPKQVENFTKLGSPASEIADYLGVSESTLRRRFKSLLAQSRAVRRMKIREFQWTVARKGNVPMLLFLGKEELGQGRETQEEVTRIILRRVVNRSAAEPQKRLEGPTPAKTTPREEPPARTTGVPPVRTD